jgi:hypothetical protein
VVAVVLASHEGGINSWFLVALLVPVVVGSAAWLGLRRIRRRGRRFDALVVALVVALTGLTLHVSVLTWRDYKDRVMCESWDPPEELERCVSERRERARGPWGIFVNPGDGSD